MVCASACACTRAAGRAGGIRSRRRRDRRARLCWLMVHSAPGYSRMARPSVTRVLLALWFIHVTLSAAAAAATTTFYYVDPQSGDDAAAGTTEQSALRTLQHAQQVVRQRRARGDAGAINVLLTNGSFELPGGLQFDSPLDGGASIEGPTTCEFSPRSLPSY
eukprot:COSAG02_NODE_1327_length_13220_cov_11.602241_6_plen_162_part_00